MIRTFDATFLNVVANDPGVRPFIGGEGAVDLGPTLANPANIALVNDHGGVVLTPHDAGRYELHTLFLPSGRGARAIRAADEVFRYVFTRTGASEVVTKVAASNPAADFLARKVGFQPIFTREAAWPDGSAVTHFLLTLDRWRGLDREIVAHGRLFHDALEDAKRAKGSDLPIHPEDDAHDRAVGASLLMTKAGQVQKAVWAYNRWARFAGYEPISLVSDVPPVLDVKDAVVALIDGQLEIVQCR